MQIILRILFIFRAFCVFFYPSAGRLPIFDARNDLRRHKSVLVPQEPISAIPRYRIVIHPVPMNGAHHHPLTFLWLPLLYTYPLRQVHCFSPFLICWIGIQWVGLSQTRPPINHISSSIEQKQSLTLPLWNNPSTVTE